MGLSIWVNVSDQDQPLDGTGADWIQFSSGNDRIIFTQGNPEVADGQEVPTESELISAGIRITGSDVIVDDYLLEDVSADLLRDIPLMGNIDAQYVLAFDFDSDTASEPVLEIWDDFDFDSFDSTVLGSGTPSQSFIKGITTTNDSSGADWVGSPLAGSGAGNFLYLNDQDGALDAAAILYAQIKLIIPASLTNGFSANPVFVVKWMDNE